MIKNTSTYYIICTYERVRTDEIVLIEQEYFETFDEAIQCNKYRSYINWNGWSYIIKAMIFGVIVNQWYIIKKKNKLVEIKQDYTYKDNLTPRFAQDNKIIVTYFGSNNNYSNNQAKEKSKSEKIKYQHQPELEHKRSKILSVKEQALKEWKTANNNINTPIDTTMDIDEIYKQAIELETTNNINDKLIQKYVDKVLEQDLYFKEEKRQQKLNTFKYTYIGVIGYTNCTECIILKSNLTPQEIINHNKNKLMDEFFAVKSFDTFNIDRLSYLTTMKIIDTIDVDYFIEDFDIKKIYVID